MTPFQSFMLAAVFGMALGENIITPFLLVMFG